MVTLLTADNSGGGSVEAHDPVTGWQPLGPVSESGWTQVAGKGLRADALRVVWNDGATPPAVHEIAPWFADTAPATFELARSEADAEIGGRPAVVEVRMINQRPETVREPLAVRAPKGVNVSAPAELTAVRAGVTTARVELSVPAGTPAGTYAVPVRLAGQERTLTVRAHPAAAGPPGPDLARGATTRVDGAWWQLELARPVRLGRLVLHWRQGRPARYGVQVSGDGRVWRDAATSPAGSGAGTETVRLDAPDARFVRVGGGTALGQVEAYAVG